MDRSTDDHAPARRYLLGELDEARADEFEGLFLADEARFEAVREAEAQLIDDYWEGRLTPDERGRFESHYLAAPRRRERALLARDLIEAAARRRPAVAPAARLRQGLRISPWAHAAAYTVLALGLGWLAADGRRLGREARLAGDERRRLLDRNQELAREIETLERRVERTPDPTHAGGDPAHRPWTGVTLRLGPGRARGDAAAVPSILALPGARLELLVDAPAPGDQGYRAEVQTADGAVVWNRVGLRARPADGAWIITLDLDRRLRADDYILVLGSTDAAGRTRSVGEYFFRVVAGPR